jgi:small subunit ribosomal protein S2
MILFLSGGFKRYGKVEAPFVSVLLLFIMEEITLQQLLEAGCHFGHKAERWHPRAQVFIYTEKDGIHIIDLAKTKSGLDASVKFIRELVAGGGEVLFVATKRQARGIVKDIVKKVEAPFFVERWVGGFLTNWESIKKNLDKAIKMASDQETGAWKKYVKHEQVQMEHHLKKLQSYYEGVLPLKRPPQALFIVDVKKENAAIKEALRIGIPIIGVVDTNSNPTGVDYVIPANDDAVGSIQLIVGHIAEAYAEGKKMYKEAEAVQAESRKARETVKPEVKAEVKSEAKTELKPEVKTEKTAEVKEIAVKAAAVNGTAPAKKSADKPKADPKKAAKIKKNVLK